jgi:ribosomal protein S18 acetylase RimI-like enzyme
MSVPSTLTPGIVSDDWLSPILGYPAFSVAGDRWSPEMQTVLLHAGRGARAFYYAKLHPADTETCRRLSTVGFYVVDARVVFRLCAASVPHTAPLARPVHISTDVGRQGDAVLEIAEAAFDYSRFHLDPLIGERAANAIKREWIASYLRRARGDKLFVASTDGAPVGFLAALRSQRDGRRVAVIDLVAVAPARRRCGIGQALVSAFMEHYRNDCDDFEVGTQMANVPSIQLYERVGMQLSEAEFVLHMHTGVGIQGSSRNSASRNGELTAEDQDVGQPL